MIVPLVLAVCAAAHFSPARLNSRTVAPRIATCIVGRAMQETRRLFFLGERRMQAEYSAAATRSAAASALVIAIAGAVASRTAADVSLQGHAKAAPDNCGET